MEEAATASPQELMFALLAIEAAIRSGELAICLPVLVGSVRAVRAKGEKLGVWTRECAATFGKVVKALRAVERRRTAPQD